MTVSNITITQIPDPNTANLVYATWAIAFATIIGISVTTFFTSRSLNESRKANRLMDLELRTKFRPILIFDPTNMKYESENDNSAKLSCMITVKEKENSVAVSNIVIHCFVSTSEIFPHTFLKNWNVIRQTRYEVSSTLEPSHYHWYYHSFIGDPTKDIWIGLLLYYEYLTEMSEQRLIVFRFNPPTDSKVGHLNQADFIQYDDSRLRAEFNKFYNVPKSSWASNLPMWILDAILSFRLF